MNEIVTLPEALAAKIAALPFTATLIHKARNPEDGPDRWICTIKEFSFLFSKGVGLRTGYAGNPRTFAGVQEWIRKSRPVDPTALELLSALTLDASLYEDCRDLDDFAANYGDPKSVQKTLDSYNACAAAGRFLRHHFTGAELEALIEWSREQ